MQLESKSRKLNLREDQRCLPPSTWISPTLFSNQILITVVLVNLTKIFSSQSSSRERLSVDEPVSVPTD